MSVKIELGMHSVIILVGPSMAGKSTWATMVQKKVKEIDSDLRCPIVSSDEIRREILGEDYHRYDNRMIGASGPAFDLLKAKIRAHLNFPITNEFLIVDTTGMDAQFRTDIAQISKEYGYRVGVVLFDYQTSEYFKGVEPGKEKEIVSKHVDSFKKRVMPGISRKSFDFSFTVRDKSEKYFSDLSVEVKDYSVWKSCRIDSSRDVMFIGDIHEHAEALIEMRGKIPANTQVVLLGDYLDKGERTAEIIPVVEEMVDNGAIVIVANHESYVARRLKGEITSNDKEKELFTSLKTLQEDKDLARRFINIYDKSVPFVNYSNGQISAFATHAPCQNKFLGKTSEAAKKAQRNFFFKGREDLADMSAELSFVGEEAKRSHPLHVFGHVAHSMRHMEDKNKIWLDTGAVYGNKLTAMVLKPTGERHFIQIPTTKLTEGNLFRFVKAEEVTKATEESNPEESLENEKKSSKFESKTKIELLIERYSLSDHDSYWLNTFVSSGASFISGTMAPAKSTETELEPISQAFNYFKSRGIEKVVLQPKLMGSRVQFYLYEDSSKNFFITRSGNKSRGVEKLFELMEVWSKKTREIYGWKNSIILDGELMPWSAIGKELIERDFIPYGYANLKENELLAQDSVFSNFKKFQNKKLNWRIEHAKIFIEQVDLYGSVGEAHYLPFNVLKMDEQVYPFNSSEVFSILNPNKPTMTIDLNNVDSINNGIVFFNEMTLVKNSFEGLVVKPLEDKNLRNCAPYMKVRNEKYLHIIYGYDYQLDYEKMCSQKRIGKKLALSIKEYDLGRKMLTATQDELAELACKMLFEIKQEESVDTRL